MNQIKLSLLFFSFLFVSLQGFTQNNDEIRERLYRDVQFLVDDALLGREAGSEGEYMARDYIIEEFGKAGVTPFFDNGSYLQEFAFKDGADYSKGTTLSINGKEFMLDKDFYPLSKSANGKINTKAVKVGFGMHSPDGKINDYKMLKDLSGKVFIIEISVPGGAENYSKYAEFANIDAKIETAKKNGASAVIFINSDPNFDDPRNRISNRVEQTEIPVMFLTNKTLLSEKDISDITVEMSVNITKIDKIGYNVIGYIDNGADKSIIIGAHYDHLGMGGESSRYKGEPAIHNGADDNASGTAAILEMARYFKENKLERYNLIFMSFSAEEKGLLGSAYFVKSKYFEAKNVAAMLNFDMVGRLDPDKRILNLIGTGTAMEWDSILSITDPVGLQIKKSRSGISGSDQMSFYLKEIPVLFFFTGLHSDYHTPNDDIEFINFEGQVDIVNYGINITKSIDGFDKISYLKTKDMAPHGGSSRGYADGVTMGIVPDFSSEEAGMGIQAVLDDKPAFKAGLKSGDLIVKLGDVEVKDIQDYMKALKTFKKGEKTTVEVMRDGKKLSFKLQF